jgi:hypothetical protein
MAVVNDGNETATGPAGLGRCSQLARLEVNGRLKIFSRRPKARRMNIAGY